jgi:enoyl-CoA hydratase
MDLILTGRAVDSNEALRIGLVERVVPDGTALAAALELATQIAEFPQKCLIADRRNTLRAFDLPVPDALRRELEGSLEAARSCVAGAQTFVHGAGRRGAFEHTVPENE